MKIIVYIKGNNQNSVKVYKFKISENNIKSYFKKAINFFKENGLIFVKYRNNKKTKVAGILEGYTISIVGNK